MLNSAPPIKDVIKDYVSFIGDSIVVGHNINFDINFIYYNYYNICKERFVNNYMDTLRLARIALPHLEHHRLKDLIEYFKLAPFNLHRSLEDCNATFDIYSRLKRFIIENDISLKPKKSKVSKKIDLKNITATTDNFDTSHPFYNKCCVFTGKLDKMIREDAARIVANLGGINENNITKKTNFLILGNNDYCSTIKDGKSTKHKKAEKYILEGSDLKIITENVFYDMLDD
jgi:DNA polymerase-3 subunit epsilon